MVRGRLGHDQVSERRACRALGQPRSTQRYRPKRPDADQRLIGELRRLVAATITPAHTAETAVLKARLQAGRLYVIDRGYAEYALFQAIVDAASSFVGRLHDNAVLEVLQERPLTPEAARAGVRREGLRDPGCRGRGRRAGRMRSNRIPRGYTPQIRHKRKRQGLGGGPSETANPYRFEF